MMKRTSDWFMRVASWKTVLGFYGATLGLYLAIVILISPLVVDATGGLTPFDTTWPLSAEDIARDLPSYGPDAVSAYMLFAIADIPYPIIAGTWFILVIAWLIKRSRIDALTERAKSGVLLLGYIPALFDLTENAAFMALIMAQPSGVTPLVEFAAFVHAGKFQSINVSWVLMVIFAVVALWGRHSKKMARP